MDESQGGRRIIQFLVIWRALVVIEVNNLGLIHLHMAGVNLVSVKNDQLMGVRLNAVLVLFTAVFVLLIQMRMRWRPLDRQKGGK